MPKTCIPRINTWHFWHGVFYPLLMMVVGINQCNEIEHLVCSSQIKMIRTLFKAASLNWTDDLIFY